MEHVTHGITLDGVARFVDIATDALSAAREEIDALNVYPVPDGDTGTNMFLTISAARDGLREARAADPDLSLGDGMAVLARAALMGARGNSGVILSQMLRAYVRHLAGAAIADRPAETIAAAMAEATEASYAAVGTPVEEVHHLVARAVLGEVVARDGGRDRDQVGADRGRPGHRPATGGGGLDGVEHDAQPATAGVDDAGLREHLELLGRARESGAGRCGRRREDVTGAGPACRGLQRGVGRGPRHGERQVRHDLQGGRAEARSRRRARCLGEDGRNL